MDPELHLFLLWEHSKPKWNEILTDMKKKFEILKVFQMKWSQNTNSKSKRKTLWQWTLFVDYR
ncbi:hypothetical protein [Peribacillus asahii]|uniref:hypothetical protein n=1 Tax=Peribacillus asahii TaxID=228899 RepID=UPI00380559F0